MKLSSQYITIIIFIVITVLFIFISLLDIYEKFWAIPEYLNHKSKSFDAEREMINRYGESSVWRAQPSKSYDSEQQGVDMYGEAGGFIGKTMKYY